MSSEVRKDLKGHQTWNETLRQYCLMIWARGFQLWGWTLEAQAGPICPCSHCADGNTPTESIISSSKPRPSLNVPSLLPRFYLLLVRGSLVRILLGLRNDQRGHCRKTQAFQRLWMEPGHILLSKYMLRRPVSRMESGVKNKEWAWCELDTFFCTFVKSGPVFKFQIFYAIHWILNREVSNTSGS